MKIRIAKKIVKVFDAASDEGVNCRYSNDLLHRATIRVERTKSFKRSQACWDGMMRSLGPVGRAEILAGTGRPDLAFGLLMRTPEDQWAGDPSAWPFGDRT